MTNLTAKEINDLNNINNVTNLMGFGTKFDEVIRNLDNVIASGTPVNAVNATRTLTLTSVVADGETVIINNPAVTGSDIYEFLADTEQTKSASTNIAVNITASTTKASGTLTVDTQPTAGDTMTVGIKKYTFVANGAADADGKISVGTDLATAQANIVAAINGTDSVNTAHPLVTAGAFAANASTITALVGGTIGNNIATTETFTAVSNIFGAAALASGANCSAANAITALVAAITASDTQGVGAVDGAGDTIDFTADTAGTVGNAITISETLTNGSVSTGTLSGGVNGTVSNAFEMLVDASYLYIPIAANTISGKNWRRISVGSAY
jgi:hypothetical protein